MECGESETFRLSGFEQYKRTRFQVKLVTYRKVMVRKPPRVDQFALFLDDNMVLRCRGRINNSSLQPESKNPTLLPSNHPFVDLLIRRTHQKVRHSSVQTTLTTLRERVWVLRGRQSVKRVLRRCVPCRRLEGLPTQAAMFLICRTCASQKTHHSLIREQTLLDRFSFEEILVKATTTSVMYVYLLALPQEPYTSN